MIELKIKDTFPVVYREELVVANNCFNIMWMLWAVTFEPFEGEHEQFGVMFVSQGRERDGRETSAFQPVHSSCVDGHGLFGSYVGSVLQPNISIITLAKFIDEYADQASNYAFSQKSIEAS